MRTIIEGVVVSGDALRPDGSGRPGGTDRPTLWLWNAVKRSIYLASGLTTEVLTATAAAMDRIPTRPGGCRCLLGLDPCPSARLREAG